MKSSFPGLSVARHSLNLSIFHSKNRSREWRERSEESPDPKAASRGGHACS